ncbi:MAG: hypothetical protein JF616_00115 [Fibrobacteres bacterium]|nr:hypothetical protein [Fibrobacterota bacterium]
MKRRARWTLWLEGTPASGRVTFTLEEAARRASAEHRTVSQALRRASKDGWVTLIHRGLYAWVAPEYRRDKVPPFYWVIQAWMDFVKTPYYVGLLSAASLHGSAQQAPMEYQVLTKHQVRNTGYGRTRVRFVVRKNWTQSGLLEKKQGYWGIHSGRKNWNRPWKVRRRRFCKGWVGFWATSVFQRGAIR